MNIILDGYKYLKECFSQLKKKKPQEMIALKLLMPEETIRLINLISWNFILFFCGP